MTLKNSALVNPMTPQDVAASVEARLKETLVQRVNRLLPLQWNTSEEQAVVPMHLLGFYHSISQEHGDVARIISAFRAYGWAIEYVGAEKDRERGGLGQSHLIFTRENSA